MFFYNFYKYKYKYSFAETTYTVILPNKVTSSTIQVWMEKYILMAQKDLEYSYLLNDRLKGQLLDNNIITPIIHCGLYWLLKSLKLVTDT